MILLALLLAAALQSASGAAPVSPDGPSPSAAPAAAKASKVADREKLICRTSAPTGRHIVERVCHTQFDWDRMEADGKAYTDRSLRGQNVCNNPGYC